MAEQDNENISEDREDSFDKNEENIEEKVDAEPEKIVEKSFLIPDSSKIINRSITEETFTVGVGNLKPREIVNEMETSYLDYAMSVIVSRALPDVRDGLKPVHRRVLYGMYETGLRHNVKYRKSAKVVGEVMGNYHPHGDMAIYDTLVRMAQDFSMRYMLVDGQGNFGSMDGDSAAAMRYTECRMTALSEEMLGDIEKDTVDWQDNYDGTTQEPIVLPARVPQLLLNGTVGIAVGMATNIPPHNLTEICSGVVELIDNPDADVDDLMKHVKGPDFPTGANIYNTEDIKTAYATGKGKIMVRAKTDIEEAKRGFRIIITEIPFQVNKASLIEKIADLVKDKKIDGISDIRDESSRHGVRIVIELRSNSYPKKVLNRLFELTQLQTAFHVNMLALTPDLEPIVMTLKDVLQYFIEHRTIVIERRTKYELRKAEDRAHILEGLKIALDHIDEIITTIRNSANRDDAKKNLITKFKFSERQADAILEMKLAALAALERKKIEDEYNDLINRIAYLKDLLAHPEKILGLIKDDMKYLIDKYGDERRTVVVPHALGEFSAEDLIPDEQVFVSLSRSDYIKRQEVDTYRKQTRGGVGVVGMTTKEEDIVDYLVCARTHDDIYFFTNKGRVFKSKVYELPATSRQSKGTPVVNIIQIGQGERVTSILTSSKGGNGDKYFIMGTVLGHIKKTEIEKYDNIRKTGIVAMGLKPHDELKWVKTSKGDDVVIEVSEKGLAICYKEDEVRPMGRSASGVTGMKLRNGDKVMAMDVVSGGAWPDESGKKSSTEPDMLIVLENGFGKRTMVHHFHLQKRAGMGIRAANCTAKTGNIIGMHITYSDAGDVVLASRKGQFIRMELAKIKRLGRDTQGVTLMRLREGDKVSSVALILPDDEDKDDKAQLGLPIDEKPSSKIDDNAKKITKKPEKTAIKKSVESVEQPPKIKVNNYKGEKSAVLPKEPAQSQVSPKNSISKPINAAPGKSGLNVKFYEKGVKIDKDHTKYDKLDKGDASSKDSTNYWGKTK